MFRLDSIEEFEMIGGVDLLYDNSVTIIEWSKKIQSLLPEETIAVSIDIEESGVRIFHINGIEL